MISLEDIEYLKNMLRIIGVSNNIVDNPSFGLFDGLENVIKDFAMESNYFRETIIDCNKLIINFPGLGDDYYNKHVIQVNYGGEMELASKNFGFMLPSQYKYVYRSISDGVLIEKLWYEDNNFFSEICEYNRSGICMERVCMENGQVTKKIERSADYYWGIEKFYQYDKLKNLSNVIERRVCLELSTPMLLINNGIGMNLSCIDKYTELSKINSLSFDEIIDKVYQSNWSNATKEEKLIMKK